MELPRILSADQNWKIWVPIALVLQSACAADRVLPAQRSVVELTPVPPEVAPTSTSPQSESRITDHGRPTCSDKAIAGGPADAQLLMIFDSANDLNAAIRADYPQTTGSPAHDPCATNTGAKWDEYHAPEVNWYYSCTGGRIVASRRSKEGDSQNKDLYLHSRGHFAIVFLARADYLCPVRPEEHCYPDEAPEPLLCESDFSIPCVPEGQEGIFEVLDVAKLVVHRLDDVRHVKDWDSSLLVGDRLRLRLNDCVVDF
jgi:hypothetical protein